MRDNFNTKPIQKAADFWVGTWSCSQQLAETTNLPPAPGLANNTLRQVVHSSIGGSQLRVQFSNEYGTIPLTLHSVHIAVSTGAGAIERNTDTILTFQGAASVIIPAGQTVFSDTVSFKLAPLSNLAVSIYCGAVSTELTSHPGSRTTSYIQPGNAVTTADLSAAVLTEHWFFLNRIDVLADSSFAALATIGDSLTDGRGSTTNGNDRWPDNLARRLQAKADTSKIAVLNLGIGGNAVFSGGLGPTAMQRFDRDILGQSGVCWLIILEGVNDIGGADGQAVVGNLIATYNQFIDKAHARNILVYGVPILPFGNSFYDTPEHETARQAVNNWIRTSGRFDAVIDMDTAVCDPEHPTNLLAAYDTGDHLHLNAAGYQKMAEIIALELFQIPNPGMQIKKESNKDMAENEK